MTRRYMTVRNLQRGIKMALLVILMSGLLVGCGTIEKSRDWLDVATDVCNILDNIQKYCHASK